MSGLRSASPILKLVLAALAALIVFGDVDGFAASLGSSTGGFGATTKLVSSCGPGLSLEYTTVPFTAASGYAVNSIDLSDIPTGCQRERISVTFYTANNKAMGSPVSDTLPSSGTSQSIPIDPSTNRIEPDQVRGVSVVVS